MCSEFLRRVSPFATAVIWERGFSSQAFWCMFQRIGVVIGRELIKKVHVGFLQVMMKKRLRGAWLVLEQEKEGTLPLGQCWGSWGGLHKRHASPVFSPWTLAPGEKRSGRWALSLWLLSAGPVLIRGCIPDTGREKTWGESWWGAFKAVCRRKEESRSGGKAPLALWLGSFLAPEVAHAAHPSCPCHCGISKEHRVLLPLVFIGWRALLV